MDNVRFPGRDVDTSLRKYKDGYRSCGLRVDRSRAHNVTFPGCSMDKNLSEEKDVYQIHDPGWTGLVWTTSMDVVTLLYVRCTI